MLPYVDPDVLVIGAGLTGCWTAKELAETGFRVLLLDAGPEMLASEVAQAERRTSATRHAAARRQPVQSRIAAYWSHPPSLFVDDFDHPYSVAANSPFTWIRGRQVGGRSLTWGGVMLRLSDYELQAPCRDGIGPRWPIAYRDLAPWYTRVERFFGVAGHRDGLPHLPDGEFLSPKPMTAAEVALKTAVETRWPDRRLIACRGVDPSPDAAGEWQWARRTAQHRVLPAALATGRVTVSPNTIVSHLCVDANTEHVRGAACVDRLTSHRFEVQAPCVVLCASTIESLRILLNSRTPRHPHGIGNSSGLLGRGLVDHLAIHAGGPLASDAAAGEPHPLGGPHAVLVPRFRNLDGDRSAAFVRGYGIWGGLGRREAGEYGDGSSWFLTALLEVIAREDNRVEIDDGLEDAWGIKAVRITVRYGDNERAMAEDAASCLVEVAEAGGLQVRKVSMSEPGAYVHELGGARMGMRATDSVLNRFNQCWDAPNLFVLDGASFVTSGWQNPSLTMLALASRACAFLAEQARRGDWSA